MEELLTDLGAWFPFGSGRRVEQPERTLCAGRMSPTGPRKPPDTAGEITTRRKEWIIPRILVEMDRTRALFLSELALRCEQIFPHRFCPIEFASSIPARVILGIVTVGRLGRPPSAGTEDEGRGGQDDNERIHLGTLPPAP